MKLTVVSSKVPEHVMLDLETLGQRAGCAVLSIGAVLFTPRRVTKEFYAVVTLRSARRAGLVVDPATERWWSEQSAQARTVLTMAKDRKLSVPLRGALQAFAAWLPPNAKVWGNGADFDQPILSAAYDACGLPVPWKFYHSRCYRTVKNLAPTVALKRVGTYHNALDDAKSQAVHLQRVLRQLKLPLA